MKNKDRWIPLLFLIMISTLLFTFFRRIVMFTKLVDLMVAQGWTLLAIQVAAATVEFLSAALVVLVIMPRLLGLGVPSTWLPGALRANLRMISLGVLSFAAFGALGAAIAKILGIYLGDLSTILAWPDIKPDPDVVGFGYFFLALVPAVWEELAFRGLILSRLELKTKPWPAVLWSALFFALFHLSSLMVQPPSAAIGGVVMAFFFGLVWGLMKTKTGSVVPAMLSHYLIDSMGVIFLKVDSSDPAKTTLFFLLLVISFTIVNVLLILALYPSSKIKVTAKSGLLEKKGV